MTDITVISLIAFPHDKNSPDKTDELFLQVLNI